MNHHWQNFLLSLHAHIDHDRVDHFGDLNQEYHHALNGQIIADLSELGIIKVSGTDAANFLQGQITCDVLKLEKPTWSACCDRKGRMLANFWIWTDHQDYFLLLPKALLESLQHHLKKYVVISKVKLSIQEDSWVVTGITQPNTPIHHPQITNIALSDSFNRQILIGPYDVMQTLWNQLILNNTHPIGNSAWQLLNIRAGITTISLKTQALFTPQMINLQLLGGISFTKGCYVGQEIIARTQHLGQLKRHLYRASVHSTTPLNLGDEIFNEQHEAMGVITELASCSEHEFELLAVIQDRAIEAQAPLKTFDQHALSNITKIEVK